MNALGLVQNDFFPCQLTSENIPPYTHTLT